MFSLIPEVYASSELSAGQGSTLTTFLPLIAVFFIFYFLVIRPQQKKQKTHQKLVEATAKGDEIITNSGIYGKVNKVHDDYVLVEIAEKTVIKLVKSHIADVVKKKTDKTD